MGTFLRAVQRERNRRLERDLVRATMRRLRRQHPEVRSYCPEHPGDGVLPERYELKKHAGIETVRRVGAEVHPIDPIEALRANLGEWHYPRTRPVTVIIEVPPRDFERLLGRGLELRRALWDLGAHEDTVVEIVPVAGSAPEIVPVRSQFVAPRRS